MSLFVFAMILILSTSVSAQHNVHAGGASNPRVAAPGSNDNTGALANATVTFGGWMANPHMCPAIPPNPPAPCPTVDRFPAGPTQFPRFSNHHELIPEVAKIKAGGSVNFIIGGLHVVTVYDDGTRPSDIDTTDLVPNRPPNSPPIINDSTNRIYRGLDPLLLPPGTQQDRVEAVVFTEPGTYLVICAVLPHFQEGMYGYVRVLPNGNGFVSKSK